MSYRILIDVNDWTNAGKSSSSGAAAASRRNRFRNYLARVLYFRRLRLMLKFYVATAVIFLLLFVLFRHGPASTASSTPPPAPPTQLPIHGESSASNQLKSKKASLGVANSDLKIVYDHEQDRVSSHIEPHAASAAASVHSNDRPTFSPLGIDDFMHMKDVNGMQVRIREALKHSWDNYRRYAWGHDMLKPRARQPEHWFNLGLTIVDAADSLIMLGLSHEASLALDWLENGLTFNSTNENSNCFEMTIRILGGLLSAHHLTGRAKLARQATEMGNILMHCYETRSKVIPNTDIDLGSRRPHPSAWNPYSFLSDVSTLQLEFRHLSRMSGEPRYERTAFQTSVHLHEQTSRRAHKLLPMLISPTSGLFGDSIITLGARSDSYYEYLFKQYLQTGIKWLEDDYLNCIDEISSLLLRHTNGAQNYTYVAEAELSNSIIRYIDKMDHFVCFLPGTLALGYYHFSPAAADYRSKYNLETRREKLNSRYDYHLAMAEDLARTCYHMYASMGTGLAPESAYFVHEPAQNEPELRVLAADAQNILRPEYVESLFFLYHITGSQSYREQAGQIFEAFEKYSRIETGYSAISDVRHRPPRANSTDLNDLLHKDAPDRMETFWLSETLKYFYLIFCDDRHIVGTLLNDYVFNTEAHMLPLTEGGLHR